MFFLAMTVACGALVWRARPAAAVAQGAQQEEGSVSATGAAWGERMRRVALAFMPSSLMMGVTPALTTDIPAIPLLWVLPLAIYLLSFVLVFSSRPPVPHEMLVRRLPILLLLTLYPTVSKIQIPYPIVFFLYMLALFAVAMVCHGERKSVELGG